MHSTATSSFGTLLRRLRMASGRSQESLAEAAGVSSAAISAYERGVRSTPHRDSVDALAGALELAGPALAEFKGAVKPRSRVTGAAVPAPCSLPPELTPFVGRDAEIDDITGLLGVRRAVTICGAGGVGKTRSAVRVASRMQRTHRVCFVDLAAAGESGVIAAIGAALCIPAAGTATCDALVASLCNRRLLLVLDNCEHVRAAVASFVAAAVRTAPNVTILATSRRRLNVSCEHVYRLNALPAPLATPTSVRDARRYAAIELFVVRARAADQRFVFTHDQVAAVSEICRRLDGLPLAIEFAAARVSILGIEILHRRLGSRIDLMTSPTRDVPARQSTLRASLDWSYALLDEPERLLLARLASFAGGCTLETVEGACADDLILRHKIVDGLTTLIDSSVISVDITSAPPRYTLQRAMRDYALGAMIEHHHELTDKSHVLRRVAAC